MKKFIKKILFNLLLTKKQKEIIFKAIVYSEYKYRQRGNVDMAVNVHVVLNGIAPFLGFKQTFTKEEVDTIIKRLMDDRRANELKNLKNAYNKGCRDVIECIKKDLTNNDFVAKIVVSDIVKNDKETIEKEDKVNNEKKEQEDDGENKENSKQEDSSSEKDNPEVQSEKS